MSMKFFPVALLAVDLLIAAPVAQAACPEPASRAAVALPVAEALQGFAAMDGERFQASRDKANALLPCLTEALTPQEAAGFHGLMALDAFLRQDDAGAVNSFRSALAADPAFILPTALVPEGHPILVQFQVARSLASTNLVQLPDIAPKAIRVDGVPVSGAPTDRPSILQRVSVDGSVEETVYLATGGALPRWSAPVPLPALEPAVERKRPILLAVGAGAALLASGACYGLANRAHDAFVSPGTDTGYPDEPDALRAEANGLTWASIGTAAVAAGLGTVAVIRW